MKNGKRMNIRGGEIVFLMAAWMAAVLSGCAEKPVDTSSAVESSLVSSTESRLENSASSTESYSESSLESVPVEKKKPQKPSKADSAPEESRWADTESDEEEEPTAFSGMLSMGWLAPTAEELSGTTWYTWNCPGDASVKTEYFLELYGGETCENGDYDGEASLSWLYEGDEEYQESYEGWWRVEQADEKVCLRLDLLCTGGALYQGDDQHISDLFPALLEEEQQTLVLFTGIQNETFLPFLDEDIEFEFLTRSFG